MTLDGCLAMAPKSLGISHGHWITSLLEECCGPIVWDACDARGFCHVVVIVGEGIVGEDKFAFNNTCSTPARQPCATSCLAAGRRSQALVRSAMAFCYASVSVRDASVRGKGRSPPEQLLHLRTFFQPGVRTSGVSMKGGRYADRIA
jgi:hypothetical protein